MLSSCSHLGRKYEKEQEEKGENLTEIEERGKINGKSK
jgi:hypothetical protein